MQDNRNRCATALYYRALECCLLHAVEGSTRDYFGKRCHAGVEDWLLNGQSHEHSSPTADTADMPQEWVQWRAALHALAALTEAQA